MSGHVAALKALFLLFLATCRCAQMMQRHSTSVALEATHSASMHIVIAMYQEDISEVQKYVKRLLSVQSVAQKRPRIFLYVKGGPDFVAQAKELAFAHTIIELPNIGREQETYIRHLVAHYATLPRHVLFSQALPNSNGNFVISRLESQFSTRTGALGLGNVEVCTCEGHSDVFTEYGAGGFIRLREVLNLCCTSLINLFHGQRFQMRRRLVLAPEEVTTITAQRFQGGW